MHVGMARYGRLNEVNQESWPCSSWRQGFLHAAAACRWAEEPSGGQRLRDAPARHLAACDGILACASGSVCHLQWTHAACLYTCNLDHAQHTVSIAVIAVCTLQDVQLYDVDRQRWRQTLQAGAEVGGLTMAGPRLLLAAAGPEVLLWRGSRLMRRFHSAYAAAIARRSLPRRPWRCHRSSPPAACCLFCVVSICPIVSFTYKTALVTPCKLCLCRCAHRCAAAEHS